MIAHFGTGLMGAGFVRAARERGEDVAVWNRSPEKAQALVRQGAVLAETPREAATGRGLVLEAGTRSLDP